MDAPKAGFRQRVFAWALARFNKRYERFVSQHKRRLFADVAGIVLEIGPGTGVNLRYLMPDRVGWMGVEPNPFMEPYLRQESKQGGYADRDPNRHGRHIASCRQQCGRCDQHIGSLLRPLSTTLPSRSAARPKVGREIHLHRACSCAAGEPVAAHSGPADAVVEAIGGWVPPKSRNLG